ncbi:MAG: DUF5719 family protein, partial [Acidimicrobiales bacterium]
PSPPPVAALAAPIGSESSSWFCAGSTGGQGTSGGAAVAVLQLVNASRRPVSGTLTVVDDAGRSATRPVTVPADGQLSEVPTTMLLGSWLASRIDLDGGGVSVSQVVSGPLGWSESPCASSTSPQWYFPSGSTTNGSLMFVALYNPNATDAVVDLTFVTSSGLTQPSPFQGLVVGPGRLVVAGVASYVQNQASVATVVDALSGQVVAEQLQQYAVEKITGVSLALGSPVTRTRWFVPRSVNVTGGETNLNVLNPTSATVPVTVRIRLASGSVTPFVRRLAPSSEWTIDASAAIRIPTNSDYAVEVDAGRPGVVVDRALESSSSGSAPQWGTVPAVDLGSATASRRWVLPDPAPGNPQTGASPFAVALQNPSGRTLRVTVSALGTTGREAGRAGGRILERVVLAPRRNAVLERSSLAGGSGAPLLVEADGPLAVAEDAVPAGMPGVVSMPGVPQG